MTAETRTEASSGSDPLDPGLAEFYREVADLYFRYALKRDLSVHDAKDAVQQVMLKLHVNWYQRMAPLEPEARRAYAWKILDRTVTDFWRNQQRDLNLAVRLRREPPPLSWADESAEDGAEALRLIRTLTRRQYQVMALAQEGLKPREIAERLGLKASTVCSHLHDARTTLMTKLQARKESGRGH
ncbi:RNA polymerase sigma factor [Actinoplanes sp. DH11]|uniref:RNA polymerase sigma factor n=1 Tax=Actinoplanes sp. DH11 TaxID=2857011 RepID=UPI001E634C09|nr:sigma-70 family RNA polymerase sigma factor [Actinoplanes sp. DH11]